MRKAQALISLPKSAILGATATLLAAPMLAFGTPASADAVHSAGSPATPPATPAACTLGNGGFEDPPGLRGAGNLRNDIPNWHTTASDGLIEIWGPGNVGANGAEVPADSGTRFAEINGTQASALYQDVATTPKSYLVWRLAHRARTQSTDQKDVIRVKIGAPGDASTVQIPVGQTGGDISDGGISWGHYYGVYRVPKGQKVTRISIESVSAASGSPSVGNFLDSVEIVCAAPGQKIKLPGQSCNCPALPLPQHPATPPAQSPSHQSTSQQSTSHSTSHPGTAPDPFLPRPAR